MKPYVDNSYFIELIPQLKNEYSNLKFSIIGQFFDYENFSEILVSLKNNSGFDMGS